MNTKATLVATLTAASIICSTAYAEDPQSGRSLHERSCVSCHDTGVYTREKRMVGDLPGLRTQVERCAQNPSVNVQWFDDEKNAVVRFLNENYYHF